MFYFFRGVHRIHLFQESKNFICVTEDKVQRRTVESFAQNIKQLESSYETNKRKRKQVDEDDFDYLYGILTTARDCISCFILPAKSLRQVRHPLPSNLTRRP